MKNSSLVIKLLILLCSTLFSNSLRATVWRVYNQTTSTSVFSSVQAAIDDDGVFPGDTILIEGSSENYSGFDVNKRLVILGTGYFVSENPNSSLEGKRAVISGTADFNAGSEGSIISSVLFSNSSVARPRIYVDDIWVNSCYLLNGFYVGGDLTGIVVTRNYFDGGDMDYSSVTSVQGTIFRNNIVNSDFNVEGTSTFLRTFASVANNLFLGDVTLRTSTYRNNIWLPLQASSISITAGIKEYNINISVDMGSENNNQVITSLSQLYNTEGTTDGRWKIKDDSAFKNSGKDGTDPGPYGGATPYVLSGLPNIPIIYEISTTGFGSQEEGLPISIKVRSN